MKGSPLLEPRGAVGVRRADGEPLPLQADLGLQPRRDLLGDPRPDGAVVDGDEHRRAVAVVTADRQRHGP